MDWQAELKAKFGSSISRAFTLSGNVQDYVAGVVGQTLRSYLVSSFISKFDVVVVYSRSGGFWFPKPLMQQKFLEVVGLAGELGAVASNAPRGLSAALNQRMSSGLDQAALEQIGKQPAAALALLTKMLAYRNQQAPFRAAVILEYGETLAPASDTAAASESDRTCYTILADWGRDQILGAHGNLEQQLHVVLMVVANLKALAEPLRRSGWENIEIPLPDYEQRLEFIQELLTEGQPKPHLAQGVSAAHLARLTTGLTFRGIEDVFLRAIYSKQAVTIALVKQRKDELVAAEFDEVLRIVESESGFEALGGMERLKSFFRENVIEPMREGQHSLVPQGLLLMGPAGTGKSRIAKALAREAGVTFVELQPSKIFSKWVGETERSLERALTAIRSMTPCIVFIDEVDQSVSRGEGQSGDSGVSNRFFKRLMEFMADTSLRGKVLFIAATNRPDLLDAALKRAGRFDVKVPVLAPDAEERAAILEVLTHQAFPANATMPKDKAVFSRLALSMENYTGAEIELVATKAARVYLKGAGQLSLEQALEEGHNLIIPTTQDITWMTRLALENCSDLELVPQAYHPLVRQLRQPAQAQTLTTDEDNLTSNPAPVLATNGAGRSRTRRKAEGLEL
jgi:SpoVK/Ycf46/Vps4 family AAA+-type ATPase